MNENDIIEKLKNDPELKADDELWPGIRLKIAARYGEIKPARHSGRGRVFRAGLAVAMVLVVAAAALAMPKITGNLYPGADINSAASLKTGAVVPPPSSVAANAVTSVVSKSASAISRASSSVPESVRTAALANTAQKSVFGKAGAAKKYDKSVYSSKEETKISINNKNINAPVVTSSKSAISISDRGLPTPTPASGGKTLFVMYNHKIYQDTGVEIAESSDEIIGIYGNLDIYPVHGVDPSKSILVKSNIAERYDYFMDDTFVYNGVSYRIIDPGTKAGNIFSQLDKTAGGLNLYTIKDVDTKVEIVIQLSANVYTYAESVQALNGQ